MKGSNAFQSSHTSIVAFTAMVVGLLVCLLFWSLEAAYYLAIGLFILGAVMFPGFMILDGLYNFDPEERFVFSPIPTIVLIGLSYVIARFLDTFVEELQLLTHLWVTLFLLSLLLVLILILKQKGLIFLRSSFASFRDQFLLRGGENPLVLIFIIQYVMRLSLQALVPYYLIGGDWWEHYNRTRFFLYKQPASTLIEPGAFSIVDRPPLSHVVSAFFLVLFEDEFWVFQVIYCFLNTLVVLPTYLLGRRLFGARVGFLAMVFVAFNPYITANTLYTWPKNFTAFFCLSLIYFVLDSNLNWVFIGLNAGCAFLSHTYSIFFVVGSAYYVALKSGFVIPQRKDLIVWIKGVIVFGCVVFPWLAWSRLNFSDQFLSRHLYFVLCYEEAWTYLTFSEVVSRFSKVPMVNILWVRLLSLYLDFVPCSPSNILNPLDAFLKLSDRMQLFIFYGCSFPGAATSVVFILGLFGLIRGIGVSRHFEVSFFMIPLLGALVMFGWPTSHLGSSNPTIPLLIVVALGSMVKLKSKKWLPLIAFFVSITGFSAYILWFYITYVTNRVNRRGLPFYFGRPFNITTAWEMLVYRSNPVPFYTLVLICSFLHFLLLTRELELFKSNNQS